MKDGSAPAFDPGRISELAALLFSSGLPITRDPRPKALAASIPTFPMKLSLKIPLAFVAALVLMFAGALYGIFALNGSIDAYRTEVAANVTIERMASAMLVTLRRVSPPAASGARGREILDFFIAPFLRGRPVPVAAWQRPSKPSRHDYAPPAHS
jgi:hypothetical protein